MRKNGYTTIELVVVLGIFSIAYFASAIAISKNFNVNYEEELYNQKIAAIEKQASIYGENKEDLFKDGDSVYMTIEDLAKENVIVASEEGVVADPRDSEKNLNDLKVKITSNDNKVTAKVLS